MSVSNVRLCNIRRVRSHAGASKHAKNILDVRNIITPKYLILFTSPRWSTIKNERDSNKANSIPFHDLSPSRTKQFLTPGSR